MMSLCNKSCELNHHHATAGWSAAVDIRIWPYELRGATSLSGQELRGRDPHWQSHNQTTLVSKARAGPSKTRRSNWQGRDGSYICMGVTAPCAASDSTALGSGAAALRI